MSPLGFDLNSFQLGMPLEVDKQKRISTDPFLFLKWAAPRHQNNFFFFLRLPHCNEARSDPRPQRLGPGLGDHPQWSSAADQGGDHVTSCGRHHWAMVGTVWKLGLKVQVLLQADLWVPQFSPRALQPWFQSQSFLHSLEWELMTSARNSPVCFSL